MITLYQFPRINEMPNLSPFCMKLESYLRAMGIAYEVHETFDPRKSPTGKVPYVSINGEVIADSGLIIEKLESEIDQPMDKDLSNAEKAVSLAFIRLMEEHLYWAVVYSRWLDPKGAEAWAGIIQKSMRLPKLAFKLILSGIKKNVDKSLQGHGLGRLEEDKLYQLACNDIKALADFLGGRDFCFGSKPTLMDHALYAMTCSVIGVSWDYPLKAFTLKCQNLIDHYKRMSYLFFSDLANK
ncbi:glutathione S-transferase family protein [Thiotrichales bacterium 19S9-12]|nr:glutathione S-transferase family protein [Thiotrichales bacterium 19S9-11]MCF6811420.1 glutathione S-transferase family protein [Thiotrichales bacterium 19S9-12]